ncbi:MAG TPA: PHP domain-containing protein [Bacillota bacterium]|nr:PHP domain-containing protein [Bacillota bacterium]
MFIDYSYDLHIHSCLSPCGDEDMTVNNIAGMAALNRLSIAALTDHNSSKNCPAFYTACRRNGVVPVAGMELTTAEEIHLICLFELLEQAAEFDEKVYACLPDVKNRESIFGQQLILDDCDNVIGKEEKLLINATTLSLADAWTLVKKCEGVCYPAHIDREANGIVAILGTFPEKPEFGFYELNNADNYDKYREEYPILKKLKMLSCSDAHYLYNINEAVNTVALPDRAGSAEIRHELFGYIRGQTQ